MENDVSTDFMSDKSAVEARIYSIAWYFVEIIIIGLYYVNGIN